MFAHHHTTHTSIHTLVPALYAGTEVEIVPHSSVVVHWGGWTALEYDFGSGIYVKRAGQAVPCEIIDFGTTAKTRSELIVFLRAARCRFTLTSYDVFTHNSNHFSDDVVRFLTGQPVPKRILNMINEALSTPRGQALRDVLQGFDKHTIGNILSRYRQQLLRRCFRINQGLFLHNSLQCEPREPRLTRDGDKATSVLGNSSSKRRDRGARQCAACVCQPLLQWVDVSAALDVVGTEPASQCLPLASDTLCFW